MHTTNSYTDKIHPVSDPSTNDAATHVVITSSRPFRTPDPSPVAAASGRVVRLSPFRMEYLPPKARRSVEDGRPLITSRCPEVGEAAALGVQGRIRKRGDGGGEGTIRREW